MNKRRRLRIFILLLAAGIVLAGPFIYDNGLRAAWMTCGLALVLLGFGVLARRQKSLK